MKKLFLIPLFISAVILTGCGKKEKGPDEDKIKPADTLEVEIEMPMAVYRNYYTGVIGDKHSIQADIEVDSGDVNGTYYYEKKGDNLYLTGTVQNDNLLSVQESNANGYITGYWEATINSVIDTLYGTWYSEDHRKTLPLELYKKARYIFLEEGNDSIHSTAVIPEFENESDVFETLNTDLRELVTANMRAYVTEMTEAGMQVFSGFNKDYIFEIKYYADDLISVFVNIYEFSGGAHPNSYYNVFNYRIKGDTIDPVMLQELFLPESAYLEFLSEYVRDDLFQQDAPAVVNGEITFFDSEMLEIFVFNPHHITFHFAPYHVGPYVEGSFSVEVPIDLLKEYIDPAGPLGNFIK